MNKAEKKQNTQYQKENENRNKSITKAKKKSEGLKGLTIQSLENREEHLRHKLERSKATVFDQKMVLIQIEFDLKHSLKETNKDDLLKKKAKYEKFLKANEKRTEYFWKLLDEVARERKKRTLKPKSKLKLW